MLEDSDKYESVFGPLRGIPATEDTVTLITVIHLTGRPLYNSDALDIVGMCVIESIESRD